MFIYDPYTIDVNLLNEIVKVKLMGCIRKHNKLVSHQKFQALIDPFLDLH